MVPANRQVLGSVDSVAAGRAPDDSQGVVEAAQMEDMAVLGN